VKPQPAVNAAAYLSAYFVKSKRGKQALWESVQSPASAARSRAVRTTTCLSRPIRFWSMSCERRFGIGRR
jgi:hypothetical protein